MPSPTTADVPRGCIIPIGGAENKAGNPAILVHFVGLAGGPDARIAIVPTASEMADTGDLYASLFQSLGAGHVDVLPVTERAHANRPDYLEAMAQATGVFITGGNQLRLSTILGGTPLAVAIRRRNAAGMPVAGTSAGAAILPEHMIAGGEPGATPTADGVLLAPGLGLTNHLMVDQHFRQRDRLGRLLTAVSYNPFSIGVGLDEDTALCLYPDGTFEVFGSGGVTIVDPGDLVYSSMDTASAGEPINLIGINLHILASGGRFDTVSKMATPPPRPVPEWEIDETAEGPGPSTAGDQGDV